MIDCSAGKVEICLPSQFADELEGFFSGGMTPTTFSTSVQLKIHFDGKGARRG